jgi:hypothetical protein
VTTLRAAAVGSGYPFLLDFGVFHDELTDGQRAAMGREVTAVAAPGATLLMIAWARRRRGPLPRGANRSDIEAAYPERRRPRGDALHGRGSSRRRMRVPHRRSPRSRSQLTRAPSARRHALFTRRSQVCNTPNSVGIQTKPPLPRFTAASLYVVLRRDPAAHEWLAEARRREFEAPEAIRALLAGRSRIEVAPAEAEHALAWAAQLPGWNDDAAPPLFVHTPGDIFVNG